jgi:site-specific DNA-cytosine methylase
MHGFVEVCAGFGGLGSGFMGAGFSPLLINELDGSCCGTAMQKYRQIGNAAPARMAYHLGVSLFNQLGGVS